jgi:hypothetical protein
MENTTKVVENDQTTQKRETIKHLQRFMASSIALLDLLKSSCVRRKSGDEDVKLFKSIDKFLEQCDIFIKQMRDPNEDCDMTHYIRKAFDTLKIKNNCDLLNNKNSDLFRIKDTLGRIMTIIPGINIIVGYGLLTSDEEKVFWQYMHLFSISVFRLIEESNPDVYAKPKYAHVLTNLTQLESEIAKTGVMFNNHMFNPFLGIGESENGSYGVSELFTGGELPNQQSVTMESVLSMMGVEKMFDESKLKDELANFSEESATEATNRIAAMLGASDNPEVREVCGTLITDIVSNFKENGIQNIGQTLMKVADNAKNKIDVRKMKQTAHSMQNFMANSQEMMKNMKDQNGNPVGEQLMNSMAVPLNMMKMMNPGMMAGDKSKTTPNPASNSASNSAPTK